MPSCSPSKRSFYYYYYLFVSNKNTFRYFYIFQDLSALITELQNRWCWRGPSGGHLSNPLLKQGHLQLVAQHHVHSSTISIQLIEAFSVVPNLTRELNTFKYLREPSATTAPVDQWCGMWGRLTSASPVNNIVVPSQFQLREEEHSKCNPPNTWRKCLSPRMKCQIKWE